MAEQPGAHLDADAVATSSLAKAAAVSWPYPADRRLDQLVELANQAGANTRRNELVAALVAAAVPDGESLLQLIITWRRAHVRDVVLNVDREARTVEVVRHPPGRRRPAW